MPDWTADNLAAGRACVRKAGFAARNWRDCGDGIVGATVWTDGAVGDWVPKIWLVPQYAGRSIVVPGFAFGKVQLWGGFSVLRGVQTEGFRSELSRKLQLMRKYLGCWRQMPVPAGGGELIGEAVEAKLGPWKVREIRHHGKVWQAREPMDYRGISLLQAFEEIVEAEWRRRELYGWPKVQAAKAISKLYDWWRLAWAIPGLLEEEAKREIKTLWLSERKAPKVREKRGRKRSLISDETARRLRAERREARCQDI